MKFSRSLTFALGCALLASCGGGDGGSGGNPTGGGGTPTPSPSPSPSPTPAPTYTAYDALTGQQSFRTSCAGTEFNGGANFAFGGTPFGTGVTINSNRDEPNYDISSSGDGTPVFSTTFTQADRDTTRPNSEVYVNAASGDRLSNFAPRFNSIASEYARLAQILTTLPTGSASLFCAFGVPTQLNDIPSSTVNYDESATFASIRVTENFGGGPVSPYSSTPSIVTATANPNTGEIAISIDLKGFLISPGSVATDATDLGVFTATTSIDGTVQTFDGLVVDEGNVVAGNFGGWFFGPQGETLGAAFTIQTRRADNSDLLVAGVFYLQ